MIGQNKILNWVEGVKDAFPHFIVLIGPRGSGKRLTAKTLAYKISCVYTEVSSATDAVRDVIDSSYRSQTKVMYCFADADNMRPQAKNAMLKITEEPPKNAYFCMTVRDSGTLLETIKSRAYVMSMQPYSINELAQYVQKKGYDDVPWIVETADTPGEVNELYEYGQDFIDYVQLVIDNISEVQSANAFKSSNKLMLKGDSGYDLSLFWKAFINECFNRLNANLKEVVYYSKGIDTTAKYLAKAERIGVNKQQLYDSWVFEIRQVWS